MEEPLRSAYLKLVDVVEEGSTAYLRKYKPDTVH